MPQDGLLLTKLPLMVNYSIQDLLCSSLKESNCNSSIDMTEYN